LKTFNAKIESQKNSWIEKKGQIIWGKIPCTETTIVGYSMSEEKKQGDVRRDKKRKKPKEKKGVPRVIFLRESVTRG
jgi:hypothetical protein